MQFIKFFSSFLILLWATILQTSLNKLQAFAFEFDLAKSNTNFAPAISANQFASMNFADEEVNIKQKKKFFLASRQCWFC